MEKIEGAEQIEKEESQVFNREEYAKSDFWEERFKSRGKRSNFDWYIDWTQLKTHFDALKIPNSNKILNVGCGDSKCSFQMYEDGYEQITNIDISQTAIETMKAQEEKKKMNMEWQVMDALNMEFEDQSFDDVIDKGTLDALSCGTDYTHASTLLKEMYRVCKIGGHVWLITNSPKENRQHIFEGCFEGDEIEVQIFKQFLSDSVNLINIMRSVSNGKSIKQVIFDAEAMKMVRLKFNFSQLLRKRRQSLQKWTDMPFEHRDIKYEKVDVKIVDGKPKEDTKVEETVETTEEIPKEEPKPEETVEEEPKVEETIEETAETETPTEKTTEETAETDKPTAKDGETKDTTKVVKVANNKGYNAPRQDHCFIYLIKRLK